MQARSAEWPGLPAPPVAVAQGPPAPRGKELASWGARALGALVDFVIRLVIVGVPALLGAAIDAVVGGDGDVGVAVGLVLGGIVAYLVYAPLLMARRDGQTWGHSVAGVRVVRRSGAPIGGGKAFVREVLVKAILIEGFASFFLFGIGAILNYLWPLWDDRNETIHDKMCETLVIKA